MTNIHYHSLKISHLQNSSGLFIGNNIQKGRSNKGIINEGFGTVKGKNSNINNNIGSVVSKKTGN